MGAECGTVLCSHNLEYEFSLPSDEFCAKPKRVASSYDLHVPYKIEQAIFGLGIY